MMKTIYWAGDSTVSHNTIGSFPQTGMSQEFNRFIDFHQWCIHSYAQNGLSASSFIEKGLLEKIDAQITEGEFLFIQFGINDCLTNTSLTNRYLEPDVAFPNALRQYVEVARRHGAIPVLITPLTGYNDAFQEDFRNRPWVEAVKRLAAEMDVALVDLNAKSRALVQKLGKVAQTRYYLNLPAGVFPHFFKGNVDNSHLQPEGAVFFCGLLARGLMELGGVYADLCYNDVPQYIRETDAADIREDAAVDLRR